MAPLHLIPAIDLLMNRKTATGTLLPDARKFRMTANRSTADYALGAHYFLMPRAASDCQRPFDQRFVGILICVVGGMTDSKRGIMV
ncbi:MAG: hypothetical protein H6R13_469 [Proteobacteria bacterium]|nr:hypothetical protein [Pseudomonadota bacterium]